MKYLLMLPLIGGCAFGDAPPAATPQDVLTFLMQDEMVAGGVEALPPQPIDIQDLTNDTTRPTIQASTFPLPSGSTFVLFQGTRGIEPLLHGALVSASGVVTTVAIPHVAPVFGQQRQYLAAALTDGVLLVPCGVVMEADRGGFRFVESTDAVRPVAVDFDLSCSARLGPSPEPDRVAMAELSFMVGLHLRLLQLTGDRLVFTATDVTTAVLPGGNAIVLVEHLGAELFRFVTEDAVSWQAGRTDGSPIRATNELRDFFVDARFDASGALSVVLMNESDVVKRWRLDDAGQVEVVATAPVPMEPGWSAWQATGEVGRNFTQYSVPVDPMMMNMPTPTENDVKYLGRTLVGSALVVAALPPTPCAELTPCFRIGESRLVTIVGKTAFYSMWSWLGPTGVYAVPIAP